MLNNAPGENRPSRPTLESLLAELEAAAGLAERLLTRGHDHEAMTALHASLAIVAAAVARATTGPVDLIPGRTGWSVIPPLLALEARKIGDFGRASGHLYLTTRTGLLDTIRAGHCAQEALNDAAQTVGVIMAYADHTELSEADATGAAWMVCGIAEL